MFGAVERDVWIPLCAFWMGLGLASSFCLPGPARPASGDYTVAMSRALLPLHAAFILQLTPLPAFVLRLLSPGSFAAHFLPDPGDGRFRPLTVAAGSSIEAWLYVAGLQGLAIALAAIPRERRHLAVRILLGSLVILAIEGFWQSRTAHSFWLYGRIPILAPSGLDTGSFGPYFNRNHFATLMAVGAALAAGLAATARAHPNRAVESDPRALSRVIWFLGACGVLILASFASGSRSGVLAALAGAGIVGARALGLRRLAIVVAMLAVPIGLSSAAAIGRFTQMDFLASRWAAWKDMLPLLGFFPVFGSGFGTFVEAYLPYQRNETYEIWEYAHNEYLQCAIEGGVLGIVALATTLRRLRASLGVDPAFTLPALGVAVAFATQAFADFPARVPANAAIVVSIFSLTLSSRRRR